MSDRADVAGKIFLVVRKVFINGEGELRSGWRALAFIFIFIVAAIIINGLLDAVASLFPAFRNLQRDIPRLAV